MKRATCFAGVVVLALMIGAITYGAIHAGSWFAVGREYLRYGYVLPANVERRATVIDGEQVSFLVVHVPTSMEWRLANDSVAPKAVHEWREDLGAFLVLNGSYFTENYDPTGYYAVNGVQYGDAVCPRFETTTDAVGYTFGVVVDHGKLEIVYIPDIPETYSFCTASTTGFASFPTIVKNGVSMIEKDSELKARRTMLARRSDGDQQIIVTESGEVTLYDAAQWLLDQPEMYELVGNLDGGPSTGISMKGEQWDIEIPSAAVPNVLWGI